MGPWRKVLRVFLNQSVRALGVAALAIAPVAVFAQMPMDHQHHMLAAGAAGNETSVVSGLTIPDVALVNQRGETVHVYSDLIKGKAVVINTIFTTCTTICPLMGANFASLRKILDTQGQRNVNLISISIDPVADTPARLQEWQRRFGQTGPGWTLLTGSKSEVDRLLKALRIFTADKNDHEPIALIGGGNRADWVRASALMSPSRLAELVSTHSKAGL